MRLTSLFAALPIFAVVGFTACADAENADNSGVGPDEPGADGGDGAVSPNPDGGPKGAGTPSVCQVTKPPKDKESGRIFKATLLLPETAVDGELLVDARGRIVCADKSCASAPGYDDAAVVTCKDAVISPGLVNAHDHISFANNTPQAHGTERYEHRHDWRKGIRTHTKITTQGGARDTAILAAELRFVMTGATSTASSGGAYGLLRNVDDPALREGLGLQPAFFETFPLSDSAGTEALLKVNGDCSYPSGRWTAARVDREQGFLPHIAEGIDEPAHNEFTCQSGVNPTYNLIKPQTGVIHGIAVTANDVKKMHDSQAILIWSPRSNVDLYGNTAPVVLYDHVGVPIALGTDWLASGSMNMARELRCADDLNQKYFGKHFTDKQLWQMVTFNAALSVGMGHAIGKLQAGYLADVAIFENKKGAANAYRAVIDASPEDVVLVMRGGRTLYGDTDLLQHEVMFGKDCEDIEVCARTKKACVKKDNGEYSLAQVKLEGDKFAPLFTCSGQAPPTEPSCVPKREPMPASPSTSFYGGVKLGDDDGDGVLDASDNCPKVFNPIRPMDGDKQPDTDGDGIGDACDKCPFEAGETCKALSGTDADGDGVANGDDNCPKVVNPDQKDGDADAKGTACDTAWDGTPCDDQSNPAAAFCMRPFAIETLRNPAAAGRPPSYRVRAQLKGVYVTAVKTAGAGGYGFFVQAPSSAVWQGMWIATPGTTPNVQVGNKIDIEGDYEELFGLSQLSQPRWTVTDPGTTLPFLPLVVDPATAKHATNGEPYEGVLCRINGPVTVTQKNADNPTDDPQKKEDFDELAIVPGVNLRIDDFVYDPLDNNYPKDVTTFPRVTGICGFSYSNRKIWPRSASDLQ